MRKALIILALVLFAPMARAAAGYGGVMYAGLASPGYHGTGLSDTITLTAGAAVGDYVIITVPNEMNFTVNPKPISSITDSKSHTGTFGGENHLSSVHTGEIWYYKVTSALSAGDTITVSFTSNQDTARNYVVFNVTGCAGSSPVDASVYALSTGNTTTIDTTLTTVTDGAIVVGCVVFQGDHSMTLLNGTAIGSSVLALGGSVGLRVQPFYTVKASHGSFGPGGTMSVGENVIVLMMAFKPSTTHTYYVDFVGGSDTNNGTATGTPWKHCYGDTNATSTASTTALVSGDTVIFKGGVVYTGDIAIKVAGASGLPILYDGTGATWGTGLAKMDCNATYYHAFSSTSAKDYIWIKGFEIYNGKNKNNASNQTIERAGSVITGVNYGGNGDIDSEGDIFNNGGDYWWISDGRIHENENCYDLAVHGAETDSDPQTSLTVPCDKKAIKLYNNANNCVISNMVCWATGRDIFGLQGTTNTLVVDCNLGGDSSVNATNRGWFAVAERLTGSGTGAPTAFVTTLRTVVHDGYQYQGDDGVQRSHAGDWFHAYGDADGVLEADTDTHDILFDRVYCYNDRKFTNYNGTATFFIESDCYNFEWRNCILGNDFAGCIEMRDCSNMVVNASLIVSEGGQPITYKSGTIGPKAIKIRNSVLLSQSSNSANVAMGTSSGYTGDLVDSDYNIIWTTAHSNRINWMGTNYTTRVAWTTETGMDAHSLFVDPKWVALPTGTGWAMMSTSADFHPNSSQSSPLIAAGLDQSSLFTIFYDASARSNPWTIGPLPAAAGGGGGGGGSTTASQFSGGLTFRGGVIFR